jgi:hypothetical protein
MSSFKILASVVVLGLLATPAWAGPPEDENGPRAGLRGQRAAGKARPADAGQRDPQQMAAMMLKRFDQDGDQKLDTTELAAMLTAMRGMARRGGPGQDAAGRDAAGQGPRRRPGAARGGQKGPAAKPGGERPKRPDAQE